MQKLINNQINKAKPVVERATKWVVRTAFELLKLTGLAFMTIHLIAAALIVEGTIAAIVVFASAYFSLKLR